MKFGNWLQRNSIWDFFKYVTSASHSPLSTYAINNSKTPRILDVIVSFINKLHILEGGGGCLHIIVHNCSLPVTTFIYMKKVMFHSLGFNIEGL
jgi:hypothetical protein